MEKQIHLSLAKMSGYEEKYIHEAFETNWVAPLGPNVNGFEKDLEEFLGEDCKVVALSSGTAAVHLALLLAGVEAGDEVICQSFTFAASANPIVYLGGTPVFVDSEDHSWNMEPALLEIAIEDRIKKTGRLPKAIIVVHLYGMPVRIDAILEIARQYEIPVIEDAAEALGASWQKQRCGTFGKFGILSFNGNKIITTSGGGALVCHTEEEKKKVLYYATQARDNYPYYHHTDIGYNYRMSNICAGIGRGQIHMLETFVRHRQAIHSLYTKLLADMPGIKVKQEPDLEYHSNFWLTCLEIDRTITGLTPNDIRVSMADRHIETRLLWKPLHLQPVFAGAPAYVNGISEQLFSNGLCLPSGASLTNHDICRVADELAAILASKNSTIYHM